MESQNIHDAKQSLIARLELAIGYKLTTPRDFVAMREMIFRRTNQLISPTTLKRIWGYNNEPVDTRQSTYRILCETLGYKNWDYFCAHLAEEGHENGEISSSPVLSRNIDVKTMLTAGDRIKLFWHPGRECLVRYMGEMHFEVEKSVNTRLRPGDTFSCNLIVAGQPLFLSQLISGDSRPVSYVCGKLKGGIQFEYVEPENEGVDIL